MAENLYTILGVSKDASQDTIKKTYRKLARKWHPDINPGNKEAEQKFKEISMAYDCLGDPQKRKLYDEFGEEGLQAGFDAEKARQYRSSWSSFGQGEQGAGAESFGRYQSYEDIFGGLFGFGTGRGGFAAAPPARGRDVEHEITVDFLSALRGLKTDLTMERMEPCEACVGTGLDPQARAMPCPACGGSGRLAVAEGPMQFTRPCPQCHGQGQMGSPCARCGGSGRKPGTERIRVTIPQGIKDGAKIRVAGKGETGRNGGQPGDLYLVVRVQPHPFLRREEDNLYMEVPVTVHEAMAGATITIPTLDGRVKVKVPPRSQAGQTLKLKGKGAVDVKSKSKGDLFVKLVVKVPQTEDAEILEAAKKMAELYKEGVRENLRL